MSSPNGFGVNIDGDGNVIGLWVDPSRVTVDEHAYISLSPDELRQLTELTNDALPEA